MHDCGDVRKGTDKQTKNHTRQMKLAMTRPIDTKKATGPELLAWFNENSGQKPLTRFRDHGTAVRRCQELFEALGELETTSKTQKVKAKAAKVKEETKVKINVAAEKAALIAKVLAFVNPPQSCVAAVTQKLAKMSLPALKAELNHWENPVDQINAGQVKVSTGDGLRPGTIVGNVVVPAPAPVTILPPPAPLPRPVPPPAAIDLQREGEKGKRYVSKTSPDSKYHLRDRSSAEKPVSIVRRICASHSNLERKEIIALCLAEGVNRNTAATQYSLYKAWFAKEQAKLKGQGPTDADGEPSEDGSEE